MYPVGPFLTAGSVTSTPFLTDVYWVLKTPLRSAMTTLVDLLQLPTLPTSSLMFSASLLWCNFRPLTLLLCKMNREKKMLYSSLEKPFMYFKGFLSIHALEDRFLDFYCCNK